MKKTFILTLVALAALMAASCQKEETGRTLTATIEQYEHNSKAYINDEYYACWEDGDAVSINGTTSTIDIENTTATIAAPTSGNLMAFYPASRVTNLTATGGTVTLLHTQTYHENNGHQVIDNPMAAYCPEGSNELRFRNLAALLKVTIHATENLQVKTIYVKGNDNQMLWGEAELTLNHQGNPMLGEMSNGGADVLLSFETPVEISTGTEKSFYIVVPAGSDFFNLTIAVVTTQGFIYMKTSKVGQTLPRNQIGAITYTPDGNEKFTAILYKGSIAGFDQDAFGGAQVKSYNDSIILFEGVLTSIEVEAFDGCSSLTSISLPQSLISIEEEAFEGCSSLTSISLPQSLISIGPFAFYGCSSLTSISLPANLATIGAGAFSNCSSLTTISLPENLTSIGNYAFSNCSELRQVDCHRTTPPTLGGITTFGNISSLAKLHVPSGCAENYSGWDSHFPDDAIVEDL